MGLYSIKYVTLDMWKQQNKVKQLSVTPSHIFLELRALCVISKITRDSTLLILVVTGNTTSQYYAIKILLLMYVTLNILLEIISLVLWSSIHIPAFMINYYNMSLIQFVTVLKGIPGSFTSNKPFISKYCVL